MCFIEYRKKDKEYPEPLGIYVKRQQQQQQMGKKSNVRFVANIIIIIFHIMAFVYSSSASVGEISIFF